MKNPFLNKKVQKESIVEKYLKKKVEAAGGEVRKVRFLDRNGAPDRLVMFPGMLIWVELKSGTGKLRSEQMREHERMKMMLQNVLVIREKWEVDEHLKGWIANSYELLDSYR